jgi:two-component system, OmpR family, sensor histidine kinase BaeS
VSRLGLRARLVAAFVGVAALTVLIAAILASLGLHRSLDTYLERRTQEAATSAVGLARSTHEVAGDRWTREGVELLGHELVLTGYDFRLSDGSRVLLDTTKLEPDGRSLRRVSSHVIRTTGGEQIGQLDIFAPGARGNLPADDDLRGELDRAHLLAAALAGAVAIASGLIVAGWLTRPLRRLTDTARGLGSGAPIVADPPGASPEVRELGSALRSLSSDLERQQRSRRQLAQDLSHELRTPMMLIQGRIEAMQDGVVPLDSTGLDLLHEETLRLGRLVDQIERLAEAEAAVPNLRSERLDLAEVAHEAHAALAGAFGVKGLRLDVTASRAPVLGDPDAVRQITLNLLSNALKYGPADRPVVVSSAPEEGWGVLRVSDSGQPLGPRERSRVFERFARGPGARNQGEGTGLGLSIARELAQAQGGTLEYEEYGGASSFALRLPSPGTVGPHRRNRVSTPS